MTDYSSYEDRITAPKHAWYSEGQREIIGLVRYKKADGSGTVDVTMVGGTGPENHGTKWTDIKYMGLVTEWVEKVEEGSFSGIFSSRSKSFSDGAFSSIWLLKPDDSLLNDAYFEGHSDKDVEVEVYVKPVQAVEFIKLQTQIATLELLDKMIAKSLAIPIDELRKETPKPPVDDYKTVCDERPEEEPWFAPSGIDRSKISNTPAADDECNKVEESMVNGIFPLYHAPKPTAAAPSTPAKTEPAPISSRTLIMKRPKAPTVKDPALDKFFR